MISVVIPFADRDRAILQLVCDTILAAGADEIVIGNLGKLPIGPSEENIREVHVPLVEWRPGLARNIAALVTRGDVVIFTLADILLITPDKFRDFCRVPANELRTAQHCAYLNVDESKAAIFAMRTNLRSRRRADEQGQYRFPNADWRHDGFWIGAMMAINRSDLFNRVRGWDSEQFGWGYNDRDFIARIKACGMIHRLCDITTLHLCHERMNNAHHEDNRQASEHKLRTNWWQYE